MNPFDFKAALLAKHAQHVVLVHFPIALYLAGAAFDVAARWTKQTANKLTLAAAAHLNMMAAAVFVLPTVVTGLLAWRWLLAGRKLKGLLLLHLSLGCGSAILICLVALIHFRQRDRTAGFPSYLLPLELSTAALIALAAHIGGFLSGVNIIG